jgi:hypothetical protein
MGDPFHVREKKAFRHGLFIGEHGIIGAIWVR